MFFAIVFQGNSRPRISDQNGELCQLQGLARASRARKYACIVSGAVKLHRVKIREEHDTLISGRQCGNSFAQNKSPAEPGFDEYRFRSVQSTDQSGRLASR